MVPLPDTPVRLIESDCEYKSNYKKSVVIQWLKNNGNINQFVIYFHLRCGSFS